MYKQIPSRVHVRVYSLNAIFFSFFNYFVQTRYDTGTCYCLNNLSNRVWKSTFLLVRYSCTASPSLYLVRLFNPSSLKLIPIYIYTRVIRIIAFLPLGIRVSPPLIGEAPVRTTDGDDNCWHRADHSANFQTDHQPILKTDATPSIPSVPYQYNASFKRHCSSLQSNCPPPPPSCPSPEENWTQLSW